MLSLSLRMKKISLDFRRSLRYTINMIEADTEKLASIKNRVLIRKMIDHSEALRAAL